MTQNYDELLRSLDHLEGIGSFSAIKKAAAAIRAQAAEIERLVWNAAVEAAANLLQHIFGELDYAARIRALKKETPHD